MGLTMMNTTATATETATALKLPSAAFIMNAWYVIEWSRDLTDRPIAKTVCGEAIVVFRTKSG